MTIPHTMTTNAPKKLSFLLPDQRVERDTDISGIAYDSRKVRPGDLFFALPGEKADGAQFAAAAAAHGAVAIIAKSPVAASIPVIVVDDPRRLMADVSHRFYGHPDRAIGLVGVVGTNGKSTVAAGLQVVWETAGVKSGLFGTLNYRWGDYSEPASRTTPEAPDLDRLLARMRDDGVTRAVMEVSSHALMLDRVWGIRYTGGIFTNITRDHLDFHKTFENYRDAKRLFFERLTAPGCFAAINVEDPNQSHFATASPQARVIKYSGSGIEVEVKLSIIMHDLDGTHGRLVINGESWPFHSTLWGRFNHSNLAAIAAGAFGSGIDGGMIARGLSDFHGIMGRAEAVRSGAPFHVFVDYAHTPDALDAVLGAARPLVRGRVIVLFGCGGDRDRGKRPEMAQAVAHWADEVILTSDNPRSEDPNTIIDDAKTGFTTDVLKKKVWTGPDRARAIERAIAIARHGDAVFLCGKGHEDYQEIRGVKSHFLDHEVAAHALAAAGYPPQTAGESSTRKGMTPPGGDGS